MQSESQQSGAKQSGPTMRLLQRVASLYGRGDLEGAEEACRQLLQLHPGQTDALHVLGLVAWRRGERATALDEIRKAIASNPGKPQPHNSLGVMLRDLGDLRGAEAAFRIAVDLMANYPDALTNLGNILSETGRLADAEAMHRRVVELAPSHPDGHNNLATTLSKQERWDEALPECEIAVRLQPTRAEFHVNLGNALSALENWKEAATAFRRAADLAPDNADAHANLGIALYRLGQREQAAAAHRIATVLRPDSARIWANLAAVQVDMDDLDAAQESCRKALALDADLPEAHDAIGSVFKARGLPAQAIAAFETAIRLRPEYHKPYNNLGIVFHSQGRYSDALAAYAKSVALVPDYAQAQWNKGLLHLLLGEFESGWRGYERGLDMKRARARFRGRRFPIWQGSLVDGKTILVSGEQGVGDQIMFASLLPDLVARGAKVLVVLENRLNPLLQRSIADLILIPNDDSTSSRIEQFAVDYQAPIGSLCRWLRPDAASFPSRRGYLKADAAQASTCRSRYRERFGDRPVIGISWRGGSGEVARVRSLALMAWAPILGQRDFGFVNLQYGDCRADLAAVRRDLGVEIFHDDMVDPLKSLDDFAAQTAAMDLVISIDNSTVHMAGALNVPVWALLPAVPDWRWMLGRSDSPWYSSVRLFRQPAAGEWPPVIDGVAQALRAAGPNWAARNPSDRGARAD
jgi:tetratricopeptide (TPR) repeat protein